MRNVQGTPSTCGEYFRTSRPADAEQSIQLQRFRFAVAACRLHCTGGHGAIAGGHVDQAQSWTDLNLVSEESFENSGRARSCAPGSFVAMALTGVLKSIRVSDTRQLCGLKVKSSKKIPQDPVVEQRPGHPNGLAL